VADYAAGSAYLTILPDLSGFGSAVRAELAKENISAKAKIQPELDTAALDAAIADIENKLRGISDARAKLEIDDTEAKFKIDELVAKLNELQAKRAQIVTQAETADAKFKLDELEAKARQLDGKRINIHADVDSGNSVGQINALLAAGVALGPAIIPVAAAVAAALAAIGTGAVIGAGAIGTILLGFHGIGDAVKDLGAEQETQGKTASQSAASQISSANSVASAQDGVRNAVRGVTDAQRSAAIANQQAAEQVTTAQRGVEDAFISSSISIQNALQSETQAEQTLANAQQQEQLAQESLTLARQAAQRQIESLSLAVQDGALAERQAQLNIEKAKADLDKTLANPAASDLQRRQAQLTYDQSVQQLTDIQARNRNLAADKATADAQGVEGSQQVQAAQRGVASATQGVQDAQTSLGTAQRNVDEARRKGAEQIAVAQQSLASAQARQAETARAGAESVVKAQEGVVSANRALQGALAQQAAQQDTTSASSRKLANDMAKLSPAGQEFAHFVHDDLMPKVKELQAVAQGGLLPGVEQGLRNAAPIFPQVKGLVGDLSLEMGNLATRAGSALNDPFWTNWITFIRGEAVPSLDIFGSTLGNLATGGAAILQAFKPVWDQMGAGILSWSEKFSAAAQNLQNNPQFQQFLEYVKVNGPLVAHFIGDLITTLVHLGESLGPLGSLTLGVVDGFLKFVNAIPGPELAILTTALVVGYNAWTAWKIISTITGGLRSFTAAVGEATLPTGQFVQNLTGSAAAGRGATDIFSRMGTVLPILGAAFVAADLAQAAFAVDQDTVVAGLIKGGAAAREAAASYDQQSFFAKVLTGSIVGIGSTMDSATAAYDKQRASLDPLARSQQDAAKAQNDYLDAVEQWGAQSPQAVDAQKRYTTATAEGARQQEILKQGLDKTTNSLKQQQDQLLSASDAEIRWRDALQTATDGVRNNGATLDLNTAAGRRNQQNVNDLIRSMIDEENTMQKNGATVDQLSAQHQIFHDQLVNVYTQMGITRGQAETLANQYLAIKNLGTIATDFLANTGAAIVAVQDMKNQMNIALSQITQEQIMVTFKADTGNILNSATGGAVFGPGTGTSDSIPAMLSHGEHVWTAAEVQAAGGHKAMFAMRKAAATGYATGGPVQYSDVSDLNAIGIPDIVNANTAIVRHVADKARQQEAAPSSSPGVAHWRPISLQALSIAGQAASNLGKLEMQMTTESGGNPRAINRYDINWQHGTPSVGLMQVIGPTYAAYRHPQYNSPPFEYGVSEDPLSNILSAIRYTVNRYGSLASGWQGHGYDSGGWLPPGLTMAYNGTGVAERILTAPQYQALSSAASQSNGEIHINVYPRAEHSEADIADMVSRRLSFAMRAVT
jgi:hypothetical protein